MTTRPTDEEISILIDEVTIYAAMAACSTSENERASHRNGLEKAKQKLLESWLAERQAARDGVMDAMVEIANNAQQEFYLEHHISEFIDSKDYTEASTRAALQSVAPAYNGKKEG